MFDSNLGQLLFHRFDPAPSPRPVASPAPVLRRALTRFIAASCSSLVESILARTAPCALWHRRSRRLWLGPGPVIHGF
jgi:hypothetical protein